MESFRSWGNALADLSFTVRLFVAAAFIFALLFWCLYLFGPRTRTMKAIVTTKLPSLRNPIEWLKFVSERNVPLKIGATILAVLIVVVAFCLLFFANTTPLRKLLKRPLYPLAAPQIFIRYFQNYSILYLTQGSSAKLDQIDDHLTLENISDRALTHFRILVFAYTDLSNPNEFYKPYSIDTGQNYVSLGVFEIGSLNTQETYRISMADIYERFASEMNVPVSDLSSLLFPVVGNSKSCTISRAKTQSSQAFTTRTDLLENKLFSIVNVDVEGQKLNAICGIPIKLEINYHYGTDEYSMLLMGGTYYWGWKTEGGLIPHGAVVSSFIKPRLSLVRSRNTSEPRVVNMGIELLGSGPPTLPNSTILNYYSVLKPNDDDQADQQLSLAYDTALEQRLISQTQMLLDQGNWMAATAVLSRLLNLYPHSQQALALRKELTALQAAK